MNWDLVVQEWSLLPSGFVELVTDPIVLLCIAVGGIIGVFAGIMPGLTAVMAMSLLLGFTFELPPEAGLGLLIGIFTGAIYAGSITAIMINMPGTPAAAATVLDGFPLARQGKAREAVGSATWASFFGEVIGEFITLVLLPVIAVFALLLGDWEIFLVALIGLALAGSLAAKSPLKGWIAGLFGFLVAMVGLDPIYGVERFGYTPEMLRGIQFLPALIGLFGIAEVIYVLRHQTPYALTEPPGRAITRWRELKRNVGNIIRSAFVGVGMGVVPGVGESAAPWAAYDIARRRSREPEKFGKGSHEGIIAAETANNATSGGSLIPAMVLGIPGSGTTAVLIAALFAYGLRPGPLLIVESPGFIGKVILMFWFSALWTRAIAYFMSQHFIRFLSIPREIILPAAVCLAVIGAWGTGFTKFDIWVALLFGVIGYLMRRRGYPLAPMVLGILVGPIADRALRRAILTYGGDWMEMLARPVGLVMLTLLILVLYLVFRQQMSGRGQEARETNEREEGSG
ncbi:transporter [Rubrobacter taiwanensis]|uniref:Transporter n=1 Tax=Rubrobacter taiwanensis TaxID=185139 RepID=A0A4R1BRM0_9ACTN|nr:tripartite tricarboxylate transporter permease [Rubrobacter taiwanensis]TCJ19987.1 transporter [Rubrobacter taiwanensis]